MTNKKNWYEGIGDRVRNAEFEFNLPSLNDEYNSKKLTKSLFGKPFNFDNGELHITPFDDFMADLDGFGFQDKGDYYEMVTNLGGTKGDAGSPEDSVKVKLTGKNNRMVEVTYEHSTNDDDECLYSHSQKTCVTLPADADEKTLEAHFDDDDNVVVSVKKKVKEESGSASRSIPIFRS